MAFQQWENLARGDAEDSRIAAVEHVDDLKGEEKVCVCDAVLYLTFASRSVRW